MNQQGNRAGTCSPGPLGPGDEWLIRRPTKGKDGLAAQIAREPSDDATRPTIDGIGFAIGELGLGGDMCPISRLDGADHQEGPASRRGCVIRSRVKFAQNAQAMWGEACVDIVILVHAPLARAAICPQAGKGAHTRIMDPAPCSVNNSNNTALGTRPSTMVQALTPLRTARTAVWVLGIIPPEMMPLRVISSTSSAFRAVTSSPFSFFTPATFVSNNRRSACKAAAIAPAAVSPFTLNVSPLRPAPNGAITGMMSSANRLRRTLGFTSTGSPTKPNFGSAGSQIIRLASLPDKPTAVPP